MSSRKLRNRFSTVRLLMAIALAMLTVGLMFWFLTYAKG